MMKVLVTGGTNGMGKGVAQFLAGLDEQIHEIILLSRSKELGEATVKELQEATRNNKISFVLCDLSKLSDVRNAIQQIHREHTFLDAVFINAGIGFAPERMETEDGLDPHFQVNYLSQFMLTMNLLDLLENSEHGGRVVFNAMEFGEIFWDDLQMEEKWDYEDAIGQGMAAKRMFYGRLHNLYKNNQGSNLSFYGFRIHKTVWTNQLNIIPGMMRTMAGIMRFFGTFITMEECGRIMSPLFTEDQMESQEKSGKLWTWKKAMFVEMKEDPVILDEGLQEKLWNISLDLCQDETTVQIAEELLQR